MGGREPGKFKSRQVNIWKIKADVSSRREVVEERYDHIHGI